MNSRTLASRHEFTPTARSMEFSSLSGIQEMAAVHHCACVRTGPKEYHKTGASLTMRRQPNLPRFADGQKSPLLHILCTLNNIPVLLSEPTQCLWCIIQLHKSKWPPTLFHGTKKPCICFYTNVRCLCRLRPFEMLPFYRVPKVDSLPDSDLVTGEV